MNINRLAIKSNAKLLIGRSGPQCIMVALVFVGISLLMSFLETELMGYGEMMVEYMTQISQGNLDYMPEAPEISVPAWLLVIALELMGIVLSAGYTSYCLRLCQGQEAGYKNLLDGFNIFFKLIALELLTSLFVFLWSLLLVVPGIIAGYRYRQAVYILLDDPELGVMECIRRSKAMMDGHKKELLVFDLSFLGWSFLVACFFPAEIWYRPYSTISYTFYYLALRDMPKPLYAYDGPQTGR